MIYRYNVIDDKICFPYYTNYFIRPIANIRNNGTIFDETYMWLSPEVQKIYNFIKNCDYDIFMDSMGHPQRLGSYSKLTYSIIIENKFLLDIQDPSIDIIMEKANLCKFKILFPINFEIVV